MGEEGIRAIGEFLIKVEERFNPKKIILFGSRARGDHLNDSDYDVIVVSSSFRDVHFLDRLTMLFELWDYDFDLDILAYTPEEFEEKQREIGVVNEAVKEGVELKNIERRNQPVFPLSLKRRGG
jgi:predicted nucleotidyltransferase